MPPKSAAKKNEPSKKSVDKQKARVVEDKTFGLKNKKGSKQQKFISTVQKQVTQSGKSTKESDKLRLEKETKKEEKKSYADELNNLFRPVIELQKCEKGVDPKSVLCVYFKQGQCSKGDRCKFSHDLNVARKAEKRNVYDAASGEGAAASEGMDDWDQEQLEKVVNQKHGAKNLGLPTTNVICKHFLDAVENNKYGWFWECPSGGNCHYRHALPPGFMLQRDKKKLEDQKEKISLEELIEKERMALGVNQTRVTYETFIAWKKRKRAEKIKQMQAQKELRKTEFKQGRVIGISGREMFEFNPDLIVDEDDEGGTVFDSRTREVEDEDGEYTGPVREINLNEFNNYTPTDKTPAAPVSNGNSRLTSNDPNDRNGDGDTSLGACAAPSSSQAPVDNVGAVDIDEDLFNDEDLDDLEDDLEDLNVND